MVGGLTAPRSLIRRQKIHRKMQRMGSNSGNGYSRWRTSINSPTAAPEKGGGPFMNTSGAGTTPTTIAEPPITETVSTATTTEATEVVAATTKTKKKKKTTRTEVETETDATSVPTKPNAIDAVAEEKSAEVLSMTPAPADDKGGPEEGEEGDAVESLIRTLKGTRPDILRTTTYYAGAKHVYGTLTSLPVLSDLAPRIESVAETLAAMTPLKPDSEEQGEQRSVAILDKVVCDALSYADEVVDAKKDEAIEGIVSAKKVIHELGPVQSAVGVACHVGDGVGKACGSVWTNVSNTYSGARSVADEAINNVSGTAGSAIGHVTTTTEKMMYSARSTAGSTVDNVMETVNNAKDGIGATFSWVTSTSMSIIGAVVGFPMHLLRTVTGTSVDATPTDQ